MAYGKKIFITDAVAHNLITELGVAAEYVEVIEDGTTFHTYTPATGASLSEGSSNGDKLADSSTAANRFTWNAGQVVRIPCSALRLATGAVICHASPKE